MATKESGSGPELAEVFGTVDGDRARLAFLLELTHQLRTPAGIVAGYLSMAGNGDVAAEEAVRVALPKAEELVALLDGLLRVSRDELRRREGSWNPRVNAARAESERLREQTEAATRVARDLIDRLRRQSG